MADIWALIQGNIYVAIFLPAAAILLALAVLAPFNKIVGKAISGMIPCIGSCFGCFCGFFGPWFQPLTAIVLLIATFGLLSLNPTPIGMIMAAIGVIVGVLGVLLKKLPPTHFEIMDVPLASEKYNSFWMFFFGMGFILYVSILFPIGAIFGIIGIILLIAIVIAAIVIAGPEIGAAAGVAGGAGGLSGLAAGGGEVLGGASKLGGLMGEGKGALGAMSKAGEAIPEVEAIPTEVGEGGKMKMFGGMPVAETEALSEQELQQVQTQAQQQAESSMNTQLQGVQAQEATLEQQLKTAPPEQKVELERELKQLHEQAKGILHRSESFLKPFKDAASSISFGGRHSGGFRSAASGGLSLTNICLIVFVLFALFLSAVYLLPEASPAGQALNGARIALNTVKDSIVQSVVNFLDYIVSWFKEQVTPCELGATGVPCKVLGTRPCEPFCISPTGSGNQWKGFEIKKLEIVPPTVYDNGQFSILAEFVNDGSGTATFTSPSSPKFGYYQTGGKLRCEWGFGGIIFWEPACKNIFPIKSEQPNVQKFATGICSEGGTLKRKCTLEPGEATQIRWIGFEIDPNSVRKGITVKPDITLSLSYYFVVPNDVVGSMAIQTAQEQLATSTVEKKEKRIVNKINKAYAPPGPLMIAMGTAEDQVVSGVPTLFLVQFANKGNGVVTDLSKENIKLYLPPSFEPLEVGGSGFCDFDKWKAVSELSPAEQADWNPGPGFEDYVIYQPKYSLPEILPTKNPLDTPTKICVLKTPTDINRVKTFDFKMRVLGYQYTEQKRTTISIIGTSLPSQTSAARAAVPLPDIKSFRLAECKKLANPTFRNLPTDHCGPVQTLRLGQPLKASKITVTAQHAGDYACRDIQMTFIANYNPGIIQNEQTLDEVLGEVNNIKSGNYGGGFLLGTTQNYVSPQDRGRVTKEFDTPQTISSVTAAYIGEVGAAGICPYIKDVAAVVTFDDLPPKVSVTHEPSVPKKGANTKITAKASDLLKLKEIQIFVDDVNTPVKTCQLSDPNAQTETKAGQLLVLTCTYDASYNAAGAHTYYAKAVDQYGNSAVDPKTGTRTFNVV